MARHKSKKTKQLISARRYVLVNMLIRKEKRFILFIGICFLIVGMVYPYAHIARWIGFGLAAYSAVANDSIQTIGTFIASNGQKKWYWLWLFIGVVFLATVTYSWVMFDGDVSYQRLASKGFSETPQSFAFLQIAAPLFLLIITRLKMPVSTTFLLLSSFTTSASAINGVLQKSILGYVIAFFSAFVIWIILQKTLKKAFKGVAHGSWTVAQWITTGFLWSLWIMQDAANIAVFLPRSLDLNEFLVFSGTVFFGLGIIFYLKGDKIQEIVEEKSEVKDVRAATVIDMVYTMILIIFTWVNTVPMSTTWVFIGLLGGRELAIKIRAKERLLPIWKLIGKDLAYAIIGLAISILIAAAANDKVAESLFSLFNLK